MVKKILGKAPVKEYELYLKKESGDQISVFDRSIKKICSSSKECSDDFPYCWGSSIFVCQEQPAANGMRAADDESCSSGYLNETTGLCDELPYCPKDRICTGAPESKKVAGEDCCVGSTPVCISHHCCPSNKPKWCNSPKSGNKRCMSDDEFKNDCNNGEVLIVAIKSNFKKVYSDNEINQLESKINEFIDSLNNDGLGAMFIYLDEDETSDIIGSKVTSPNDYNNIDGILDQLIKKLETKYLIIVGGYDRFVQAPTVGVSGTAQTDNIYGDITKDSFPDIAIGRILDPGDGDINLLLKSFDTFISLHNSGGLDLSSPLVSTLSKSCQGGKCYTGECFSRYILGKTCPASNCVYDKPFYFYGNNNFLYYVEHGNPSTPQRYDSFGPSNIQNVHFSKNLVMVVCCYGGRITYSRTEYSIPMTFFKNGGAVLFGSTNPNCCASKYDGSCTKNIDKGIGTIYYNIARK